jgi:hypothetical protein
VGRCGRVLRVAIDLGFRSRSENGSRQRTQRGPPKQTVYRTGAVRHDERAFRVLAEGDGSDQAGQL